eukprot:scaffold9176_cov129-Cylindrotheca_fusiformis.AAC.23
MFSINQCAFLTTIDTSVRFHMTIPMENRSKDELFSRAPDCITPLPQQLTAKVGSLVCNLATRPLSNRCFNGH